MVIDSASTSTHSLGLPPFYLAIFAITIVIVVITLLQLIRAARRLRARTLPPNSPSLPYDVGRLFPKLLFCYSLAFFIYNILHIIFVTYTHGSSRGSSSSDGLEAGTSFMAQLSSVLILATLLSIISHRERIQLNPTQGYWNLKQFLDGGLLLTVLVLGIATDAPTGFDARNTSIAYQAFLFIANLDVVASAILVYIRFRKNDIQDIIISNTVFSVSPLIFLNALFRIIDTGLVYNEQILYLDYSELDLAGTIIGGIVSIAVVEVALRMGALPNPPKGTEWAQGDTALVSTSRN